MPFPWKKNRVTRISRIVADLQSPKRGGSLVVETGFPTSLIDLFVKNRNRFQKTRFKKPVRSETPDPPPPPPPPSPATSPPQIPIVLKTETPTVSPSIEENRDDAVNSDRVRECGCGSGSCLNTVVVVAKMLMVVVLMSSVKRLTVGITVSAFALLFLEYASKRVVSCKLPFSNSTNALKSLSQRVSSCVWFQIEGEPEIGGVELNSDSVSVDEIEVVEVNNEVEICCEFLEDDSAKGNVEEQCPCEEVTETKIRVSRSGRLKSKMVKKLVPKKFRASKKKEEKPPSLEIEEIEEDEVDNGISKLECIGEDEQVVGGITYLQEESSPLGISNNQVTKVEVVENGNSSYIILLIISLIGLVLGRVQALIILTTWCFLLKIVRTLWRSQNVPLIKCSVSKS